MEDQTHILVVDDQQEISDALCEYLERNGYTATSASDAVEARKLLTEDTYDLVVLDIMMPGENGLSLCRHLSENTDIPVILLTALADDTDRIVGLEIGADDYVTKPFNPRELVARIRSVLRRSTGQSKKNIDATFIKFGNWRLHKKRLELINLENVVVPLSTGEHRLLLVFLDHPKTVLSRDELLNLTKGREAFPFERSIDNMISRLRRKIETDPAGPLYIETVWGGGYRFNAEVKSP